MLSGRHCIDGRLNSVWPSHGDEGQKTPFGEAVAFHDVTG